MLQDYLTTADNTFHICVNTHVPVQDYPTTAAFSIITKVLEEFLEQDADSSWQKVEVDTVTANAILEPALVKYQVGGADADRG